MSFVLCEEGKKYLLTHGINNANVRLGLYKNSYTIIAGSVFADITPCDFTGYSAATPSWGAESIDGGGHATQTATAIVFTQGTPGTTNSVYGYYLFDTSTSKLIGGDQLPSAPFVTASSGDTVTITPQQLVTQGT